jgi:WD40 repeat protein
MDESMLVSASKDQSCIVWDTKTRQQLHRFKHPGPITSLHIGPIPEFPNILSTFKKHQEDFDYSTQEYKPIKCEPGQIDDQTSEHHESLLKNMADLVAANNAMYKIIVESGQDK